MSTNIMTERPEERTQPGGWKPARETAPSVLRKDEPTLARAIGLFGLFCIGVAVAARLLSMAGTQGPIGVGRATFLVVVGAACLLYHAVRDREQQIRRIYGVLGFLALVVGAVLPLLPIKGAVGTLFWPGSISLFLGLLFLLAFVRNETEANARDLTLRVLGGVGLALALIGLIGGNARAEFLVPHGLVLSLLGLAFLWAFVANRGTSDDLGFRAGQGLGLLGAIIFVIALGRSVLPQLFFSFGWLKPPAPAPYLVPNGILLMGVGLIYLYLSVLHCSDNALVVLHRRELSAFFYSPIAYFVLYGLTVIGWLLFLMFLTRLANPFRPPLVEPIVASYILQWWPVISVIFVVPVLMMRSLSEENGTGTIEVLLTAPVNETTVVLSKFTAALLFFMLIWIPWGLYLVALRAETGVEFDYRPLLSFFVALAITGSNFLSMGLFFSSISKNQIVSAILTFQGMVVLTIIFFAKSIVEENASSSAWVTVLGHMSYIDVWIQSLDGILTPKFLLFHVSMTILWLAMTVKVLDARRWS